MHDTDPTTSFATRAIGLVAAHAAVIATVVWLHHESTPPSDVEYRLGCYTVQCYGADGRSTRSTAGSHRVRCTWTCGRLEGVCCYRTVIEFRRGAHAAECFEVVRIHTDGRACR